MQRITGFIIILVQFATNMFNNYTQLQQKVETLEGHHQALSDLNDGIGSDLDKHKAATQQLVADVRTEFGKYVPFVSMNNYVSKDEMYAKLQELHQSIASINTAVSGISTSSADNSGTHLK